MKALLRISFLFMVAMLIAAPFVHATSIVNVANMNYPQVLWPFNVYPRWFTQSFTTLGDGLNLSTIVLPLTVYFIDVYEETELGDITAAIWPVTTAGMLDPDAYAIVSGTCSGEDIPVTGEGTDPDDIYWLPITVTPTHLLAATTYALVVYSEWSAFNETGYCFWGNDGYGMMGSTNYAYMFNPGTEGFEPMPDENETATGNEFCFGFELIDGGSAFSGIEADAPLFLSLFLCLGLGVVGFGMTRGKEPLAAIFMMEFGVFISYMMGWMPPWILAASFAVLGIVLAYKFRGALGHG